jgi:hypothetical protein
MWRDISHEIPTTTIFALQWEVNYYSLKFQKHVLQFTYMRVLLGTQLSNKTSYNR